MEILTLGSGGAFTMNNYHSNFLFKGDEGNNLLVDCGGDIRWSLQNAGLSYKDVHSIFISHLHGDHAGGLEYIGFTKYFDPTQVKPKLYISKLLVESLWSALSPAMSSYEGIILKLEDYFDVIPIDPNGAFIHDSVRYQTVQTLHIMDGFRIVPSFGLKFKYLSTSVYFTSDTKFVDTLIAFYNNSDIIIQESETTNYKSGVHCHISNLETLDEKIKNKMYIYHYNDNVDEEFINNHKEFKKFLKPLDVIDLWAINNEKNI